MSSYELRRAEEMVWKLQEEGTGRRLRWLVEDHKTFQGYLSRAKHSPETSLMENYLTIPRLEKDEETLFSKKVLERARSLFKDIENSDHPYHPNDVAEMTHEIQDALKIINRNYSVLDKTGQSTEDQILSRFEEGIKKRYFIRAQHEFHAFETEAHKSGPSPEDTVFDFLEKLAKSGRPLSALDEKATNDQEIKDRIEQAISRRNLFVAQEKNGKVLKFADKNSACDPGVLSMLNELIAADLVKVSVPCVVPDSMIKNVQDVLQQISDRAHAKKTVQHKLFPDIRAAQTATKTGDSIVPPPTTGGEPAPQPGQKPQQP